MPDLSHRPASTGPLATHAPTPLESILSFGSNQSNVENMTRAPQTSGNPTLDAAGLGATSNLRTFPGFEAEWHAANDAMIQRVVAAFNAEKGLDPSDPNWLDPNLVKAWALQESGGHREIFTSGDMMQVNNRGDWAAEKSWFGLKKGVEPLPEESLRAALNWAWYKGETTRQKSGEEPSEGWHDTVRGTREFEGYESRFVDWPTALDNYNGGGVRNYYRDIEERYASGR